MDGFGWVLFGFFVGFGFGGLLNVINAFYWLIWKRMEYQCLDKYFKYFYFAGLSLGVTISLTWIAYWIVIFPFFILR